MEHNPYAPPKADVVPRVSLDGGLPVPGELLYSPNQIGVAAFLGLPIGAAWLAARNFRAMGQDEEVGRTWGAGIFLTLVIGAISFVLPDRFPNVVLPIAYTLALRALAEWKFKRVVDAHLAAGGSLVSWWRVVGIGILCGLIFGMLMAAVTIFMME